MCVLVWVVFFVCSFSNTPLYHTHSYSDLHPDLPHNTKIGDALHEWRELILHPRQPESPEPSDPSNSEPSDPLMPAGSAVDDSDDTVVL